MSRSTKHLADRIVKLPRMKQVLDAANQDYECFAMWLADVLDHEGVYALPPSVQEALNSGDGVYKP